MSPQISIDNQRLRDFCRKYGIEELSLFGSVLRPDFRPDSDVDVLATFAPNVRYGLFKLARLQRELSGILGRNADIVERSEVESSENVLRRRSVLDSAQRVFTAQAM